MVYAGSYIMHLRRQLFIITPFAGEGNKCTYENGGAARRLFSTTYG